MNKFIYILLTSLFVASCSEYQKALKTEDVDFKLKAANNKYADGKYEKAIRLYEQVAPAYRGKAQAEELFYNFANAYYKTRQYGLSGYQFESFVALYPKSQKVEEASFLSAKSYSHLSPIYSQDQADTEKAINKLQEFVNKYPSSPYFSESNEIIKALNEKLEKKAFEIAKQYNTISDYKAAIKALDNFIIDYPGTIYKEKALFYKFDSCYNLAINSIPSKMQERLEASKIAYDALIKFNSSTEYKAQADDMLARIDKDLQQFSK